MLYKFLIGSILVFVLFDSCSLKNSEENSPALFELLSSEKTGVDFSNTLFETETFNISSFEYLYNGGGVGIGDINNDGLPDLFFGGNMVPCKLYLNRGNFEFEDITASANIKTDESWATGISMVDINADGYMDIYVCHSGPHGAEKRANQLYVNQGNNTFLEQSQQYGLADTSHTIQAAFFDYDQDGDLDVYLVTNFIETIGPNIIRPKINNGSSSNADILYRNNGNNTFTNVSKDAGILLEGYGLGIAIVDVNKDSWPDVYVSNDYLSNDHLYINQKNGSFKDEISTYFKHQSYSAMGNDAADVDNDGLVDFITVDMLPEDNERRKNMFGSMNYDRHRSELQYGYFPQFVRNTFQHNNGNDPTGHPSFSEIGRFAGIHATDWSWSALLADYDNDGFRDLMITNGYPKDITNRDFALFKMASLNQNLSDASYSKQLSEALKNVSGAIVPNYLFHNNGDLTFSNQSIEWGFSKPSCSNGAAYADLDKDGDLDLVMNNINAKAFIYRNRSEKLAAHSHLRVQLSGSGKNPGGFGAKVYIYYDNKLQFTEHSPFRGYQSTVENTLHFGLGDAMKVDSIRIIWSSGKTQLLTNQKANQTVVVAEKDAVINPAPSEELNQDKQLFTEVTQQMNIIYKHQEEIYIDFKVQPLLPHLLSQQGPGIAVGDVNGDGLEDFFVGGGYNHSGRLFLQDPKGKGFKGRPLIQDKKIEEDLGVLFFDSDKDGDLDLYIVSGSSEFAPNSGYYQDRLYKNDGKGNFQLDAAALPYMPFSGSSVNAVDFDKDGDLDLFVGGRLSPTRYPLPGKSYILQNNGGKFTDITDNICPELIYIGMITSSLWTDFDQDGWVDLIVAGEWMPIVFFKNDRGKLKNVTGNTGLQNTSGWWNSLVANDFDRDGDMDFVAGNLGLNNEWKTSVKEPLTIFAGDFDQNGIIDPVVCQSSNGLNYPVHPRDEMISQMNFIRKKFPKYGDYAKAQMTDLFSEKEMNGSTRLTSEVFTSVYIENLGNGKFKMKALPKEAQMAPVFGMLANDYNHDGNPDLLLVGNSHATESITGRYDASVGLFMYGDGKGNFIPVLPGRSGFFVNGDSKGLAELILKGGEKLIIATQNNDSIKAFINHPRDQRKSIKIRPMEAWAEIFHVDGRKSREEFYYGSTYLSQSSRILNLPSDISSVVIYDSQGKSRVVKLNPIHSIASAPK